MLTTTQLDFSYGKRKILRDISFSATTGQVVSLLGPNGSGKSTLLRCLCRLLLVKENKIHLDEKAIEQYSVKELAKRIAFLPQSRERITGIDVYDLVAMGRTPYNKSGWRLSAEDRRKIDWAMEYMQVGQYRQRRLDQLSGGEQQRVWIAMVLAQDTPLILLDEPLTYLDLKHQWDLLRVIKDLSRSYQKTVITVFHDLNHAMEISDSVYLLHQGMVYQSGPPLDVITAEAIHEVFGVCAQIHKVKKCWRSIVIPDGISPDSRQTSAAV
jgi:ABC-type cobalamin/Fe3+-siderophores transport system ATPase subunit